MVEIEARLIDFKEDAGFIDLTDGAIQFDVSKFVVEVPERYHGTAFLISHMSTNAADVWRHVGSSYKMRVYIDIIEPGDSAIVAGPEFVTILEVKME